MKNHLLAIAEAFITLAVVAIGTKLLGGNYSDFTLNMGIYALYKLCLIGRGQKGDRA